MYKLTYFDMDGRGDPIRLIFAAAEVKFTDIRVGFNDWPSVKPTLEGGQVPVLQIGDKILTQSRAIYKYLGRKFKLCGSDEWEDARCDELVDIVLDQVEVYFDFLYHEQDPAKKAEKREVFVKTSFPQLLGRLNKMKIENEGHWYIGKNMTWADIAVAEFIRQMVNVCGNPDILNGYPHVRKAQEAVWSDKNIKSYRKA